MTVGQVWSARPSGPGTPSPGGGSFTLLKSAACAQGRDWEPWTPRGGGGVRLHSAGSRELEGRPCSGPRRSGLPLSLEGQSPRLSALETQTAEVSPGQRALWWARQIMIPPRLSFSICNLGESPPHPTPAEGG